MKRHVDDGVLAAAYVVFGEVLEGALPLRQDEAPAEELAVVPPPLHQQAFSSFCARPAEASR